MPLSNGESGALPTRLETQRTEVRIAKGAGARKRASKARGVCSATPHRGKQDKGERPATCVPSKHYTHTKRTHKTPAQAHTHRASQGSIFTDPEAQHCTRVPTARNKVQGDKLACGMPAHLNNTAADAQGIPSTSTLTTNRRRRGDVRLHRPSTRPA